MDFNHKAVRSDCNGCLCQGFHIGSDTCGVAGIHDDGKVALLADDRNSADIQGVPGGSFVCADAALTQHNIGVALGNDVLGSIEPFVNGSTQAAF